MYRETEVQTPARIPAYKSGGHLPVHVHDHELLAPDYHATAPRAQLRVHLLK